MCGIVIVQVFGVVVGIGGVEVLVVVLVIVECCFQVVVFYVVEVFVYIVGFVQVVNVVDEVGWQVDDVVVEFDVVQCD